MYNGIGLTTARGSGTNGYVQTNKFFIRPKTTVNNAASGKAGFEQGQGTAGLARKPNKEILEHDRKRQIELKLVVLEDKLADQGYTDDEISEKICEARKKLEEEAAVEMASQESGEGGGFAPLLVANKVSDTQTHQVAARKEKQMEKLRAALGIVPDAVIQLKKDENLLNLEEANDDHEISDSFDKDLNDDGNFHDKDPKNRNFVVTEVVKKHESGRDAFESGNLKKQQDKELGELSDSSDIETKEKHLKKFPKHSRQYHPGSASESDSDEKRKKSSKGYRKGRRYDSDYSESDDEEYVKGTHNAQAKRTRRHDGDESESDSQKYERERHGKSNRKHGKDVSKSEAKKYEKHVQSDDKKRTFREDDSEDEKYHERHDIKSRSHSVDRWNNKYDTEEFQNPTKGKGSTGRNQRHGTDDDHKNIKKNQKTGKHDRYVRDNSESKSSDSDGTDGSDSDSKDYKRKKADKEKSRSGVGVDRSARDRNASSVIEEKGSTRFGREDGLKEKSVPKKVDDKDDTPRKLEELYGSRGSQEMMKGKRKLEDGFNDDQPETKFRRNEVTDEGFAEKSRSFRKKDADLEREDYSRAKKSRGGHEDKHGGKTYGGEEYQKEISRKDIRDDIKEERDHHGRMRSDLDRSEEREGRRRYSRNDDENSGKVRHRKDEDDTIRKTRRDDVEGGEHRSSRRREREEERTSGRDGKDRLVDSSKRAKYDDYRSEEKRRYDGDKRDDRDAPRSRRHD